MGLNLISQWSKGNLDVVFFVYGLAFVIMGIAIWVQPKKESKFKIANMLWFLSGFGLIHGTTEFLDMWAIIKGRSPALDIIRTSSLLASYFFLFEFGRRILCISGRKYLEKITGSLGWRLTLIIGLTILVFGFISTDFWKITTIWARYLLGFPGGLLICLGFVLYYKYERQKLEPLKVKKYFFCASLFFLIYGILGGLIVPKGNFFPANSLNTDSFLLVVGIPVQIFRGIAAIIITWAICGMLRIFNWERIEELYREIAERKLAEEELKGAYEQLKETQSQLIQSEKMAAVGQLAVGAAHEINNPLFVISGETEILLKDAHKDKETKDVSKIILEQAKKIQEITKGLLEFSKQREPKRESLDVNKIIEESISLLSYQAKMDKIKIVKELTAVMPELWGDKNQVQEVFLNIMLNAVQAMEGGGILTIRTNSEKIRENEKRKTDKFKLGERIMIIEFKDTGKGMDEQTLNKLFNPFFTTKEKGTGLGLFVCYGIIDNHGGVIEASSKLGEGSSFIVKLPAVKEEGGQ